MIKLTEMQQGALEFLAALKPRNRFFGPVRDARPFNALVKHGLALANIGDNGQMSYRITDSGREFMISRICPECRGSGSIFSYVTRRRRCKSCNGIGFIGGKQYS